MITKWVCAHKRWGTCCGLCLSVMVKYDLCGYVHVQEEEKEQKPEEKRPSASGAQCSTDVAVLWWLKSEMVVNGE